MGPDALTLDPGQTQTVRVPISLGALAVTPGDIESFEPARVQPGAYRLVVGALHADFTITR